MKFFVTNHDYVPASDAHDTLSEAAEYATAAVLKRELDKAIVIGMDSDTFRTDMPAPILLIVTGGYDLDTHA